MFLVFINDMPSVVSPGTSVRLFADDCLVYRVVRGIKDQIELQRDLDALVEWALKWGMEYNPKKCQILTISNRQSPFVYMYELVGSALKHVDFATYLGVTINKSLDFGDHIRATVAKANSKLGFLKRNLKGCPPQCRTIAYLSFVRSHLEYCSANGTHTTRTISMISI